MTREEKMTSEEKKAVKVRRGWASPFIYPTALFIRDYLKEHSEASPYEVWKALKEKRDEVMVHTGEPRTIYWYFYVLERLGLVEKTGRIEKTVYHDGKERPHHMWRKYYKLVKYDDRRWVDPQRALYPSKRGKNHRIWREYDDPLKKDKKHRIWREYDDLPKRGKKGAKKKLEKRMFYVY